MLILNALFFLIGCGNQVEISKQPIDDDDDGYDQKIDCDDTHASVNPDAVEICDGLDNNCNGTIDDGASDAPTWHLDEDGDGFGDEAVTACTQPDGTVTKDGDCNDAQASIYPDAPEHCDGVDEDCDGITDNDAIDAIPYYTDADGDGYGTALLGHACSGSAGQSATAGDCDDSKTEIHPGASETDCTDPTDYNCDGSVMFADQDGDGTPACRDCDDQNGNAQPGGHETCNGVDEDCDGIVDNGVQLTFYQDADNDGFGDIAAIAMDCTSPPGYSSDASDCDDGDTSIYPGAAEFCDGQDHDCDGLILENNAIDATPWYTDADGDHYGTPTPSIYACTAPIGTVDSSTDCDDTVATIHPLASENCDGIDQDCNGITDDNAVDTTLFYADQDGDHFGDLAQSQAACNQPIGYIDNTTDCDDQDARINPAATEICDTANTDEDCDGLTDDNDPSSTGQLTWYADQDRDGFGGNTITLACDAPPDHSPTATDCNDGNAAIHPNATEICDNNDTDEDCDNLADDNDVSATGQTTVYQDADNDGYGGTTFRMACDLPVGYRSTSDDCNDNATDISPAATEVCDNNNTDEDCDGLADDADLSATGKSLWYTDIDNDGYSGTGTTLACDQPINTSPTSTDCNDANAAINPAATEVCDNNNTDEDCDGLTDDNDPSATGQTAWYTDQDLDGYGGTTTLACDQPANSDATSTDCNDANISINPAATEICSDGIDQDCDGSDNACVQWSGSESADLNYDTKIYGFVTGGSLGSGLAAGDFNGDGTGDIVIGDPEYNYNTYWGTIFGFYGSVYPGQWQAVNHDNFLLYNTSSTYSTNYGTTISNIGDISSDGKDDIVVFGANSTSFLYYGGDTGTNTYTATLDRTVTCTDAGALGNWDATTVADEWICADASNTTNRGIVYVYSGTSSTVLNSFTGESTSDFAGYSIDAGDFDGDGLEDLAIGAYGDDDVASDAGAVYLVYASNTAATSLSQADVKIRGAAMSDNLGHGLRVFDDLNNDGYADLAAGASGQDGGAGNAGAIYIVTEPVTGTITSMAWGTVSGTSVNNGIGYQAIEKGDFDGNGVEDLLIGAQFVNSSAGAVYLFYSPSSGSQTIAHADAIWTGMSASDGFGYSVAAVPDIDGDGKDEMAASAVNGDSSFRANTGAVWLWLSP